MRAEYVILGGGVAGLSVANRLVDRGAEVILVEAGRFPAHKVCGEFLSPEGIPWLRAWGIEPTVEIRRAKYHAGNRETTFDLPRPAGGLSRYELDRRLADRASSRGVRVLTGARVIALRTPRETQAGQYALELSTGTTVIGRTVFIGAGRMLGEKLGWSAPPMRYAGCKMHFRGLDLDHTLMMFALPGAYVGLSNVAPGIANLACLASLPTTKPLEQASEWFDRLCARPEGKALRRVLSSAEPVLPEWLSVRAPAFGIRKEVHWPGAMLIGDAAGSIHPATGDGLGMAITGGVMAADMALEGRAKEYHVAWRRRYRSRIRWGRWLHRAMMRPTWSRVAIWASRYLPGLPPFVFNRTREAPQLPDAHHGATSNPSSCRS